MSDDVFILHGRDTYALKQLTSFLRAIGVAPKRFRDVVAASGLGKDVRDVIKASVNAAKVVIVFFTPDEYMVLDPAHRLPADSAEDHYRWAPRPNVLFEAGFAYAVADAKSFIVEFGYPDHKIIEMSNMAGLHVIAFNGDNGLTDIVMALQNAGVELADNDRVLRAIDEHRSDSLPERLPVTSDPFATPVGADVGRPPRYLMAAVLPVAALAFFGLGYGAARRLAKKEVVYLPAPSASCSVSAPPPCPSESIAVQTRVDAGGSVSEAECQRRVAAVNRSFGDCQRSLGDCQRSLGDCQRALSETKPPVQPTPPPCASEQHVDGQCCPKGYKRQTCEKAP